MNLDVCHGISDFLSSWFAHPNLTGESRKQFDRYYGGYLKHFGPRLRHFYDRQTLEAVALIREHSARHGAETMDVLDLGAGTGTEGLWFALRGARVLGVDINQQRLELARERQRILEAELGRELPCQFEVHSILEPMARQFDLIWMEQTFHHLEPRAEVVLAIRNLLKPGGHIVVCDSNGLNPMLQLMHFRERGFDTIGNYIDSDGVHHVYGNERILTANKLKKMLAEAGIAAKELTHYRLFPNRPAFESLFGVERRFPALLKPAFTHFNFVGQRM